MQQQHYQEWLSAGVHYCWWVIIKWTLNIRIRSFQKPFVTRVSSSSAKRDLWTDCDSNSDGVKRFRRQHFYGRQQADESKRLNRPGSVASPHITCGSPRCCTIAQHHVLNNALSSSHQNQSAFIITSQYLQNNLLLCRGITCKQSPLWHTEEIRRVPLSPRYFT